MNHRHRSRALRGILLGVALAAPLLTSTADAASERITRGEAIAHFNAGTLGGRVIQLGNGTPAVVNAGPASWFDAGIRPLPGGPWDGGSFCVDDWHVFVLAFIDGGDKSFKRQDAVASLAGVETDWILDGNSIAATERTPIKRFLEPEAVGLERAFGFQDGSLSPPGDLTVGSHTLEIDISDPVFGDATFGISFNIDDTGTGACV